MQIQKTVLSYLSREKYHWPTIMTSKVSTKGKAGYLVWKLAGGQGDQDINLSLGKLDVVNFFDFKDLEILSAKPLLIVILLKFDNNKNKKEECKNY